MRIIAGLGNPGKKYENNRHNVGFMAADAIHRRHSFSPWAKKHGALVADGRMGGEKVLLVKPQGYMNLSGQAVGEAMRFHKLSPSELVVLYDELDLAPGKLRVKTGGGAGGHNGIKSIDAHCGKDYRRVRIGIGHPGAKHLVTNYVLGDFAKADEKWLEPLLAAVAENADRIVAGDDAGFMSKVASAMQGHAPAPQTAPTGSQPKRQSHIRQARPKTPPVKPPQTGPLAAMLKKLFGRD